MEVNGQLHASAALPRRIETAVPIEEGAGWALEPVWTKWRRENPCPEPNPGRPARIMTAVMIGTEAYSKLRGENIKGTKGFQTN
jgi:hypothetical protein